MDDGVPFYKDYYYGITKIKSDQEPVRDTEQSKKVVPTSKSLHSK